MNPEFLPIDGDDIEAAEFYQGYVADVDDSLYGGADAGELEPAEPLEVLAASPIGDMRAEGIN